MSRIIKAAKTAGELAWAAGAIVYVCGISVIWNGPKWLMERDAKRRKERKSKQ